MSWEIFKLSEVSKVVDSLHQTPKYSEAGYPMVRVTDVKGGYLSLENTYKVNQEVFSQFSKNHKPEQGDIIITRVGSYGLSSYVNTNSDFCLGQNTAVIIPKINNKFLYYVMSSHIAKNQIEALITGSSYKSISLGHIRNLEIPTPPLQTQKRIADILSAYDDLIENNLKRIKLLEQAAQNIYKEWFVNLRFPGHENTPINGETGLPEGWEEKGLCEFSSFKQYKTKIKVYEGEKEYLATANVDGIKISERGEYFSFDKKPSRAQIAPPLNSVWFARMSNTDKVLCFTENTNNDIMISSGFAGFKAEEKVFLPFLFCTINNDVFSNLKDSYSTGSTQVSINNKSINSIRFIEPEIQKIKEFGEKLYPSLEMINKLFVTNKKLKAARDILLPRLMNRTIEV